MMISAKRRRKPSQIPINLRNQLRRRRACPWWAKKGPRRTQTFRARGGNREVCRSMADRAWLQAWSIQFISWHKNVVEKFQMYTPETMNNGRCFFPPCRCRWQDRLPHANSHPTNVAELEWPAQTCAIRHCRRLLRKLKCTVPVHKDRNHDDPLASIRYHHLWSTQEDDNVDNLFFCLAIRRRNSLSNRQVNSGWYWIPAIPGRIWAPLQ